MGMGFRTCAFVWLVGVGFVWFVVGGDASGVSLVITFCLWFSLLRFRGPYEWGVCFFCVGLLRLEGYVTSGVLVSYCLCIALHCFWFKDLGQGSQALVCVDGMMILRWCG